MKKKIKLRDVTPEQYDAWLEEHKCENGVNHCSDCMFKNVDCLESSCSHSWVNNKDLYSDKFLNQEIEIDVEDEEHTLGEE